MLASGLAFAQKKEALTLEEAINQALSSNQSYVAAKTNLKAKKENVLIARANFLPRLDAGGSFTYSESETYSETEGVLPELTGMLGGMVTQMIYKEKFFADYDIQKSLYVSEQEQLRDTRYGIVLAAGEAYIGTLLAEKILDVYLENRKLTLQNLQAAKDRKEFGSASRQEVLRWEVQLYANDQTLADQRARVVVNRVSLNQVRNRPAEEVDSVEPLTVEKDGFIFSSSVVAEAIEDADKARIVRDYLVALALANSPTIASVDKQIVAQRRQYVSDKRWLIPSFSASGGGTFKYLTSGSGTELESDNQGFWQVGLSLEWPILAGGAYISSFKQAKSELQALNSQRTELKTSLEKEVRSSVAVVIAGFKKIGLSRSQAEAADENYQLVYDSYLMGESSLLVLLDAQRQKLQGDYAVTVALYTFLLDLLILEQGIAYFPFLESEDEVSKIIQDLESKLTGGLSEQVAIR
jgi:outer membrane protein